MSTTSSPAPSTPSAPSPPFDREQSYQSYLAGLLTGDRARCRACFEEWLVATPDLRTIYEDLVQRALYDVGERWERGRISVATEHLATAISEGLLNLTYPRLFARPRVPRSAVISCVANEHHQIGGRMVADLFALHGWRADFLGASTPLPDVLAFIAERRPDAVALSVATSMALPQLVRAATEIGATFPALPILVGGQGFRWGGAAQLTHLAHVSLMPGLRDLEAWIAAHGDHA